MSTHDVSPLLFGAFCDEIDVSLRHRQVALQQAAIRQVLGDDGHRLSPAWLTLERHQQALTQARNDCLAAARAIVLREPIWDAVQPGQALFDRLSAAQAAALRAEMDMARALGQLTDSQAERLKGLLDSPKDSERPPDDARVTDLALLNPAGNEVVAGVMVITHERALQDAAGQWGVLVWWPGAHGGLAQFDSLAQLEASLLLPLAEADADLRAQTSVSFAPILGDAFAVGLNRQWRRLRAHARAIQAGQRLYADADTPAASLQRWQQEAIEALSAPRHDARDQALSDWLHEQEAARLTDHLPAWLGRLDTAGRTQIKGLTKAYVDAQRQAQALLHRALAPRDEFVDTQLAQRLQADFGVQPEHLVIDVPATVSAVKQLIGGSGAPGTPSRLVHTPSERREQLALAELALWGTDEVMAARLRFGHVLGHGLGVATTLPSVAQLCALMAELDLPAQYEQCLRQAFTGLAQEDVAQLRLRRATLLAPWQAGLRLQGRLAQLGGRLDEASLVLLHNPEAAMHWVQFRPGRGPDGSSQAVSLSGVILLQAAGSPLTLLYLPDAPNGKVLTRHQGLAQACAGLARMASDTGMTAYLASLPLVGDVAEHEGHIRQALLNGYEGFVAPGQRVQTAATLAEHQLNLQLGRLIARHRATARSQDQLWLAAAAQGHGQVFVIIKMLVGLVPFVGTAVGLYDAFDSAMNAVDAWRRGRPGDSLDEMENMLVALIGAAMDVLPTMTAGLHVRSGMHRARAARGLPAPEPATVSGSAFHGYQSHVAVTSLREGSDGVCRLGEAQYILRGGLAYEVQWDAAYRTWRLKGSAHKTYRQPVVRGVDGQWRSHGAAYGHLVDGGLAGGGATATRLADAMVDRLPLAVQRRLPRWLGDALVREERRIFSRLLTEEREVTRLLRATEQVRSQYATQLHDESLRLDVVRLGIEEVQACDQLLASLVAQRGRIDSRVYRDAFQATRYQAMGRMQTLVRLGKDRLRSLSFEYTELQAAQHRLVVAIEGGEGDFTEFTRHTLAYLKRGRVMREAMLEQAEFIEHWSKRFEDQWHGASLDAPRRADIERIMSESDYRYQPRLHQVIKAETLLKLVFNENLSGSPERLELARLFARDVRALNSLLSTWRDMGEVSHLSQAHRRRILDQFVGEMEHFRWRLEEWTTAYPEHVDLRSQKRVLRQLKVLTDMAQAEVSRGNVSLRREQPEGGPRKRVFETVENRVLIGVESGKGVARVMQVNLQDGSSQHYQLAEGGKWRLQEGAAEPLPLSTLKDQALVRLDKVSGLVLRAEGYWRRGMALASVDDLLGNEGRSLIALGTRIESLGQGGKEVAALVQRLRDSGQHLTAQATALRVRLSKASQQPTMAQVHYLLDQAQVRLERRGGRVPEGFEGQSFLQEYAVVDAVSGDDLWFAHFHYQKQRHAFDGFSAAHLKRADQRLLGAQWEAQHPPQRVWRSPISAAQARQFFEPLN